MTVVNALRRGEPGPFAQYASNGVEWRNAEGNLPQRRPGYYTEWSVPGQERVVSGLDGEIFYSPDHGGTFYAVD